jgi:hypothetical protein
MTNIYKGAGGIIAPPNLATNGSFRINQRQLFTSGYSPAKNADNLSDCWKFANCTADTIEAHNNTNGNISLVGVAKKGQRIELHNRDFQNLGEVYRLVGGAVINHASHTLTASVSVVAMGNSVPMKVVAIPRYDNGAGSVVHRADYTTFKAGTSGKTKTSVISNRGYSMTYPDRIEIEFLEDGDYSVHLSNFSVVSGAYENLPRSMPVHLTEDLIRCQRYYQYGHVVSSSSRWNGSNTHMLEYVSLPTEMAGTPTVTLSNLLIQGVGDQTDISGDYIHYTHAVDPKGFSLSPYRAGEHTPGYMTCDWSAEIV